MYGYFQCNDSLVSVCQPATNFRYQNKTQTFSYSTQGGEDFTLYPYLVSKIRVLIYRCVGITPSHQDQQVHRMALHCSLVC